MEIASGKGEKGDVEKPGTRWEWRRWRRVEREDESTNEEQGTGVGEKGEEAKRKYENGDCKKRRSRNGQGEAEKEEEGKRLEK